MQIIALVFFLLTLICQIFFREWLERKIRYFFSLATIAVAGGASYVSWAQYKLWASTDLTKLFLPPKASWSYFVEYSFWKFWAPYVISFGIGLIFFWLAKYYNRRRGEQFFYGDELYVIWLAIFLVGHPLWLFYLLIIFSSILLVSVARLLIWKNNSKLPLYYFWLPTAVFVILISKWIVATSLFLGAKV